MGHFHAFIYFIAHDCLSDCTSSSIVATDLLINYRIRYLYNHPLECTHCIVFVYFLCWWVMISVVLMIVVVEGDELAVSSSMIICQLDGVVVGEGVSANSEGRERSEAMMYSRLLISINKQPFANCNSQCSFLVLE